MLAQLLIRKLVIPLVICVSASAVTFSYVADFLDPQPSRPSYEESLVERWAESAIKFAAYHFLTFVRDYGNPRGN